MSKEELEKFHGVRERTQTSPTSYQLTAFVRVWFVAVHHSQLRRGALVACTAKVSRHLR